MKLAWRIILHDRVRFVVTVLGIALAVFVLVFQGSLVFGFLAAASKLIEATDSDIWIAARGITCFEFSAPVAWEIVEGIQGVMETSKLDALFAEHRAPSGRHQT